MYTAFTLATFSASTEISMAVIFASVFSEAMAMEIHPDPVPISKMFGVVKFPIQLRATSTRRSVSGRGINTLGFTFILCP